ncbi:hypothetical protein ACLMJK_000547 [Lecanora helva]
MAEPIGLALSGISVAALVNNCIECMELLHLGQNFKKDYQMSNIRLTLLRARLITWWKALNPAEESGRPSLLPKHWEDHQYDVLKCLLGIKMRFEDSCQLEQKYGVRSVQIDQEPFLGRTRPHRGLRDIAKILDSTRFISDGQVPIGKKIAWAVFDKKKFDTLLTELKELIEGLESLNHTLGVEDRPHRFWGKVLRSLMSADTKFWPHTIETPAAQQAVEYRNDLISIDEESAEFYEQVRARPKYLEYNFSTSREHRQDESLLRMFPDKSEQPQDVVAINTNTGSSQISGQGLSINGEIFAKANRNGCLEPEAQSPRSEESELEHSLHSPLFTASKAAINNTAFKDQLQKRVNEAYVLLNRRQSRTLKMDLLAAQKAFLQVLTAAKPVEDNEILMIHVLWGLMISEKELSCCNGFDTSEKLNRIREALRYNCNLVEAMSRYSNGSSGHVKQIELEQKIIKGRIAQLKFKQGDEMDEVSVLKKEAIEGIDVTLEELRTEDFARFEKVGKVARAWEARFRRIPVYIAE